MSDIHADLGRPASLGGQGTVADFIALMKLRVMSLVTFTALVGMVAAPGEIHPWLGFVALLLITAGAGAAGALNMWYDADIDSIMRRTAKRPVPSGAVQPGEALAFGLTLAMGSVLMLGLLINWSAAALLAFTIFFYVVIYTMWLKRRTAQNIVIGGAAGALPPMIGWAAVTGSLDLAPIALFLIIFVWTPPHFWALALLRNDDYVRAGVPMLPAAAGAEETRRQILLYSMLLVAASFVPALLGAAGPVYAAVAAVLGVLFLIRARAVHRIREGAAAIAACKGLFGFSILYLFAIFALILCERLLDLPLFAAVLG